MSCNVHIDAKGLLVCERSLVGCVKICQHHPEHEKALADLLSKPPLHERRLDETDAVHAPWEGREATPEQKAKTKQRRVKNLSKPD